jgi:HAD superfamily hydrolase (TIGR01509 family)
MIKFLIFDLGQTLVHYYTKPQFKAMMPVIFESLCAALDGRLSRPKAECWERMLEESHENADLSVRPLEARLKNIFGISAREIEERGLIDLLMAPLLATSSIYEDTAPMLAELKSRYTLALLSNMPWGCPKAYFENDLKRYGIDRYFKELVFCADAGFRKPHPEIFRHALGLLGARPEEALMIGDRPDWDIEGAQACGIAGVLIDREGEREAGNGVIHTLRDLPGMIAQLGQ